MERRKIAVLIAFGLVATVAFTTPAAASSIGPPSPSDMVDDVSDVRDQVTDGEDAVDRQLERSEEDLAMVEDGIEESSGPSEHTTRTVAGCALGGLAGYSGGPVGMAAGCGATLVAP